MLLKMTLLLFTAAAAVKDRQCARIPNALIFVAACNGVFLQVYSNGWSGILKVVLGAAIPLILFGWLFALAMLGAGDLKLLMAVGVYTGPYGIVKVLLLALISGAVLALAKILKYGLFKERMIYFSIMCSRWHLAEGSRIWIWRIRKRVKSGRSILRFRFFWQL